MTAPIRAAVSSMEGITAVKLLPAYVKRGWKRKWYLPRLEKMHSMTRKYLKDKLDPEEDEFEAAAKFRRMTWTLVNQPPTSSQIP